MKELLIDATNAVTGRLASYAAKQALLGAKVDIINCEQAVITGNKAQILEWCLQKRAMGQPTKGTFISRLPDRFVRRIIRGMLPHKKPRGAAALKRIMCYRGIPPQFKDKKAEVVESLGTAELRDIKHIQIEKLCRLLGSKR